LHREPREKLHVYELLDLRARQRHGGVLDVDKLLLD